MAANFEIGAYYFPNYHVDPRNEKIHGPLWTEWELVKRAVPRFSGHRQPRVPLWGHQDEADPEVFARKIDAAADHGIGSFIFDWYWYNDGPFLRRCLEEGYLKAPNRDRLKFALMWANHDWEDIHPAKRNGPRNRLYPGAVTLETFNTVADYVIENYFKSPSYWCIDGKPYFSIYELFKLVDGLGGLERTRAALEGFRRKAVAAGLAGIHLNAVVWGVQILPGEQTLKNPDELLSALGFDSVSSYVWVHHAHLPQFPATPYLHALEQAQEHWQRASGEFHVPFFPNVTMGWDASPRTVQSDGFTNSGYPFMATLGDNTPANFKLALQKVKAFLDAPGRPKVFSINAWNEWTEGSYLEPDTVTRLGYLQAIRDVFGKKVK